MTTILIKLLPSVIGNKSKTGFALVLMMALSLSETRTATGIGTQPRDVFYEKAYCLSEAGRVVEVDPSKSKIPQVQNRNGGWIIQLDFDHLRGLSDTTARFLFTRACFEASANDSRRPLSRNIECDVLKYISRRQKSGHEEVNLIVQDLLDLRLKEADQIARRLNAC